MRELVGTSMRAKTRLRDIGEFGLIAGLRKRLPAHGDVVTGIGDDCAVVRSGRKGWLSLYAIDTIVEGVHFLSGDAPGKIGRKALAVNISDIAAMGGIPECALVSIGAPANYDAGKIERMYDGMRKLAKAFSVQIVGGDTVNSPERLVITVAITGKVEKERVVLRSGARPGDCVFVTGTLGGSLGGRHLIFTPRVEEARFLSGGFRITSMIDLSDGLASDLKRIIEESGTGAVIQRERIPVSAAAIEEAYSGGKRAIEGALMDGEDFELLFTIDKRDAEELKKKWKRKFRLRLTEIGEITAEKGFRIVDECGGEKVFDGTGYDHFG